jgi:hypothetical protein
MGPNLITVREFANRKGLCLASVYQKLWVGRLPGVKRNGRWFINADDNSSTSHADERRAQWQAQDNDPTPNNLSK